MKHICGWCDVILFIDNDEETKQKETHGICRSCFEWQDEDSFLEYLKRESAQ